MTAEANKGLDYERPEPPHTSRADDVAYVAPMATFLLLIWLSSWFSLKQYPLFYSARVLVVAVMLVALWRHYTRIRWSYWWLGLIMGVIGIYQWVPMQLWLQNHVEFFRPPAPEKVFDPYRDIASPAARWAFIGVRLAGAVLVVPVMEELFWRDYLWRQIIAPNDFKLAHVGEWDWKAFLGVSVCFAVVHGNWWLTSIVWGTLVGLLLVLTRSLGACIIMHATTNLLLGAYVLRYHDWSFW